MREIRPSGSEGGARFYPLLLPYPHPARPTGAVPGGTLLWPENQFALVAAGNKCYAAS